MTYIIGTLPMCRAIRGWHPAGPAAAGRPCRIPLPRAARAPHLPRMRWFVRTLVALILAWAVYLVSPYVALYGLARAVEARDMALIGERVDFPALRLSLARQISAAYAKALGGGRREGDAPASSIGVAAGAALLEPLLEPYVSPEAVLRLMREGWPGLGRDGAPGAGGPGSGAPDLGLFDPAAFLTARNLGRLWDATEWRGFATFLVRLPQGTASKEPLQLQFRLASLTWRLSGIELPADLRDRLVRDLAARQTVEAK
ncbi:MAG TPA: DUF2939 domain-containing protein [Beijerinckiaceae bacterium]